jgi:peptidoglycan/xylan/chitin deacetylase (PgdA/CDA1 family)
MIVGSHSATHPVMDGLEEAKLRAETGESKRALESRLGIKVRHFAYPQGRFSPAAEKAVRDADYDAGWATRNGRPLSSGERYAIGRVAVSSYITGVRFRWEHWWRRVGLKR